MVSESLLENGWFSDNQNAVYILQMGSQKPGLQKEALTIFQVALGDLIHIEPKWIPRIQNEQKDTQSLM